MPITVNHIFTCPQPDIPAQAALGYVVPTDWNSVHTASLSLNSSEAIHLSAGTQSVGTGLVVFADSNGIAFGMSGSSQITASHNGLTSQSNQAVSGSNGSFAFQTVTFGSSNGMHFYTTNGSMVGSYTVPTQSTQPVAASGSNGSFAFSTLTFGSSNGMHFYTTNGSIVGSYTVPAGGAPGISGSNGSFTFNTVTFGSSNGMHFYTTNGSMVGSYTVPTQSVQDLSLYAVGNTTSSASSTVLAASNLSFSGMGVASVGMSAGAVIISVPAGGAGDTLSGWDPIGFVGAAEIITFAWPQNFLRLYPFSAPNVQFDRVVIPLYNTNSSNSSGQHTLTFRIGIYTKNASTLSLLSSTSATTALTHSGTAGSYSLFSGRRNFTIPWTVTLSESNYFIGLRFSSASAVANGSYSIFQASQLATDYLGIFGVAPATSDQFMLGLGQYSATSLMPNAIGFSDISGTPSSLHRAQAFYFASGTV